MDREQTVQAAPPYDWLSLGRAGQLETSLGHLLFWRQHNELWNYNELGTKGKLGSTWQGFVLPVPAAQREGGQMGLESGVMRLGVQPERPGGGVPSAAQHPLPPSCAHLHPLKGFFGGWY